MLEHHYANASCHSAHSLECPIKQVFFPEKMKREKIAEEKRILSIYIVYYYASVQIHYFS